MKSGKKIIGFIICIAAIVLLGVYLKVIIPNQQIKKGDGLLAEKNYDEAITQYELSGNQEKISEAKYQKALSLMEENNYQDALVIFEEIPDYNESAKNIEICQNNEKLSAIHSLVNNGDYEAAYNDLLKLKEETEDNYDDVLYDMGVHAFYAGDFKTGDKALESITEKKVINNREIDDLKKTWITKQLYAHNDSIRWNYIGEHLGEYIEKYYPKVTGNELYKTLLGNWSQVSLGTGDIKPFTFNADGTCSCPGRVGNNQNWSVKDDLLILSYSRKDGMYCRKVDDDLYLLCAPGDNRLDWILEPPTTSASSKKASSSSSNSEKEYRQLAIRVYEWCQDRFDYYDNKKGYYTGDKYDKEVFEDAAKHFGKSYSEISKLYSDGGIYWLDERK